MNGAVSFVRKATNWIDKSEVKLIHQLHTYNFSLKKLINILLGIQREEEKVKRSLKESAKKGDKDVCIILAKEILHSRKAISKIHTSKAHINSISMQMKNQLGISHFNIFSLLQLILILLPVFFFLLSYSAHCWLFAKIHRRDEGNAATYKDPRNFCHNERSLQRNDEGNGNIPICL